MEAQTPPTRPGVTASIFYVTLHDAICGLCGGGWMGEAKET